MGGDRREDLKKDSKEKRNVTQREEWKGEEKKQQQGKEEKDRRSLCDVGRALYYQDYDHTIHIVLQA